MTVGNVACVCIIHKYISFGNLKLEVGKVVDLIGGWFIFNGVIPSGFEKEEEKKERKKHTGDTKSLDVCR